MRAILATLILASACSGKSTPATGPLPQPEATEVELAIASVTLADDCGTGPTAMPAPEPEQASQHKPSPGGQLASEQGDRACEQSSVQLQVVNGTKAASTIEIKKVELIDESGAVLGELEARAPSQWASDAYQPWDQHVASNQTLQVSYALSGAPSVSASQTYRLRVTIAAGGSERTIEHTAMLEAPASLPPGAVT